MNSEMQRKLYEMEVTPPQAVWEKLSLNIDEINEDNLVVKKIFNVESAPPAMVWEKISFSIDEINEDNRLAQKILNAELAPPAGVWEKIDSTIIVTEETPAQKEGIVINFKRLAAAAIFIGVIATAWILLRNNNKLTGLAGTEPSQQKTSTDTNNKKDPNFIDSPVKQDLTISQVHNSATTSENKILASINGLPQSNKSRIFSGKRRNDFTAQPATAEFASLNEPLAKSFNEPIDDLSSVTSDQNYYTMVNANGRLVKIPAQLAPLAPHLQDKPISEDYYEVMFGEGNYWKETLDEWRKKIVSAPATTGDAFTSLVELLKNVQSR